MSDVYSIPCGGEMLDIDIDRCLTIDMEKLVDVLCRHAADQAWWNACLGEKEEEVGKLKVSQEAVIALQEIHIRNKLTTNSVDLGVTKGVKITEGVVSAVMAQDPEVQEARKTILQAKKELAVLRAVCEGFKSRTITIANLGGNRRAEIEANMASTINKAHKDAKESGFIPHEEKAKSFKRNFKKS